MPVSTTPEIRFATAMGKVKAPDVQRVVLESYRPDNPGIPPTGRIGEASRAMSETRIATNARNGMENGAHAPAADIREAQKRIYEAAPNDTAAQEKFLREGTYVEHGFNELSAVEQNTLVEDTKRYFIKQGIDATDPDLENMARDLLTRDSSFRRELNGVYQEIGVNKFDGEGRAALDARLGEATRKQLQADAQYQKKVNERDLYKKQLENLPNPDDITGQISSADKLNQSQVYTERTKRKGLREKVERLESQNSRSNKDEINRLSDQIDKLNEKLSPYDTAEQIQSLQTDYQHKIDQCDIDITVLDGEKILAANQLKELEPEIYGGRTTVDSFKKRVKSRFDKSLDTALERHFTKQEKNAEQIRAQQVIVESAKNEADTHAMLDSFIGNGLSERWADPALIPEIKIGKINKKLEWAHKKLIDVDFYQLVLRDNHPDKVLDILIKSDPKLASYLNSNPDLRDRARTTVVQQILQARERTRAPGEVPIMKWHRNQMLNKPWANATVKDMLSRSEQFRAAVAGEMGVNVNPNDVTDADAKSVKEKMQGSDKMTLFMLLMGLLTQAAQEPQRQPA